MILKRYLGTIPGECLIAAQWNHRRHYLATDPMQIRVDAVLSSSGDCNLAELVIDGTPPGDLKPRCQRIDISKKTYKQLAGIAGPPMNAVLRITRIDSPPPSQAPTIWVDEYTYLDRDGDPFLSTLEVVFAKPAQAKSFVPPSWFGKEVTDDERYSPKGIYDALLNGDLSCYKAGEAR